MKKHEAIKILEQIVYQEEKKLISSCPADSVNKKVVLYSLLRGFDTYFLFAKDNDKHIDHYHFGWLKALSLVYGDYVTEERYPLFRSEEKMLRFAHWFVLRAGEIEFCRKVIDFIKAGLGKQFQGHIPNLSKPGRDPSAPRFHSGSNPECNRRVRLRPSIGSGRTLSEVEWVRSPQVAQSFDKTQD